jgi:FHA domain
MVAIAPGDGLIARFGDLVMYIANQAKPVGRLLTIAEAAAEAAAPAAALADLLASETFGADASLTVPFVLVAPTPDGALTALLRGAVIAEIEADGETFHVAGDHPSRWVEHALPPSVSRVTAAGGVGPLQLRERPETDLRAGVVLGGGFALRRLGAVGRRSQTLESSQPTHPMIRTSAPTAAHRVGGLTFGDGAEYPLDRSYVLGRDPSGADDVRNAKATPIFVSDDRHVSRVHAYVTLDDGSVSIRDASTPGGTYIAAPGTESWTTVGPAPVPIGPGWRIRIGERIMTYVA